MTEFYNYVTKDNDRWDLIAYKFYNDPTKYEIIIQANPEVDIAPILAAGVKLKIPVLDEKEEYLQDELLNFELEYLGFYLSGNPISMYKSKYNNNLSISDLESKIGKYINIILSISKVSTNKKEQKTCFLKGNDENNEIDLIMFNNVYEKNKNINKGDIVKINGKVLKDMARFEIIINTIEKIN